MALPPAAWRPFGAGRVERDEAVVVAANAVPEDRHVIAHSLVEEVEAGGQAALVIYHPLSGRELRSLRHRYSVTRRTSASRTVACTSSSPLPRMKHDRVARLPLLGCETNGSRTFGTRGVRLAARR